MTKGELTALPGEETISPVAVTPKYATSEYWPLEKLQLWDKNPRGIKEDRFKELKARLSRQGQVKPLLVTKNGTVIGGNMRLRAMTDLNWDKVWVSVTEAVTDKEIFDLALTDNEEFGYYEQEQLAELALSIGLSPLELKTYEVSLGETTTLDLVVDKFGPEDVEEDEVPEVDDINPPESKVGEVYELGRHRVMCGDSKTDASTLLDVSIDMVLTDPPYNIGYADMKGKFDSIANDKMSDEDFVTFLKDTIGTEAETYYVCCSWQYSHLFRRAMEEIGKPIKAFIVWNKVNPAQNLDKYFKAHEIILYSGKFGGQKTLRSDVWEVKREQNTDHPTMKPIELLSYALKDTPEARTVYDPFLGSGSTLIACEQTDRTCYGMELDPKYVDVIRKRYANHIGEGDNWQDVTPAVKSKELAHAN